MDYTEGVVGCFEGGMAVGVADYPDEFEKRVSWVHCPIQLPPPLRVVDTTRSGLRTSSRSNRIPTWPYKTQAYDPPSASMRNPTTIAAADLSTITRDTPAFQKRRTVMSSNSQMLDYLSPCYEMEY